jgi:hypothetical protein
MAHTERINLTDNAYEAVAKMAEGNIRTLCVTDLMKYTERGRPFEFPKVIGPMMLLDSLGIYPAQTYGNIQGRLQGSEPIRE